MKGIFGLGVVALVAMPLPAHAISCSFLSVGSVAFGGYDVFSSAPLDTMGSLTYACTGVTGADNIILALSSGGSGSFGARALTGAGGTLDYNLYLDAGRTIVWGDGTGGSSYYGPINPPNGTNATVSVFGRVPALQDVSAGAYADSITVTVNY